MKNWTTIALLGVIIILLIALFTKRKGSSVLQDEILSLSEELTFYQAENGAWIAEMTETKASYDNALRDLETAKAELNAMGLVSEGLKTYTKVKVVVRDTIPMEPVYVIDTIERDVIIYDSTLVAFEYSDQWLDARTEQHLWWQSLVYEIRDEVTFTVRSEKNRVILQGANQNPNARITGIDYIEVKQKPARFGVGPHLGVGITPAGLQPYLGVGVHYSLIKF